MRSFCCLLCTDSSLSHHLSRTFLQFQFTKGPPYPPFPIALRARVTVIGLNTARE